MGFVIFILIICSFILFRKVNNLEKEITKLKREKYFPSKTPEKEVEKQIVEKPPEKVVSSEKEEVSEAKISYKPPLEEKAEEEKKILEIEKVIGERYLVWIGIFVFAAGFATFLKYAFSQGWLNENVRIFLGFLAGFIFAGLSHHFYKRKYYALSWGFFSLGLILFYLTVFTAFRFYKIFNSQVSFILFFAITISGMSYSVKRNSFSVGFLSLLGAFATPLLLADPSVQIYYEPKLFSYLLIINLGVVYISLFKKWRALSFTSFIFTLIYLGGWFLEEYRHSDFKLALSFSIIYFIVFSFIATFYSLRRKEKSNEEDVILAIINPAFFFFIFYHLFITEGMKNFLPLIPLFMSIYHFILAFFVRKLNSKDILLYYALAGTSIGLLTLPIPLAVQNYWITLSWAYEAVILILAGILFKRITIRTGGLLLYLLVILRLIFRDPFISYDGEYMIFLNMRFFAMFLSCLSFPTGAMLLKNSSLPEDEKNYSGYLWGIFLMLIFWIFNFEIISYFTSKVSLKDLSLIFTSIFWSIFALILCQSGGKVKNQFMKIVGLALFYITFFKILFIDTFIYEFHYGFPFLLNLKFLSLVIFLFSAGYIAWFYFRTDDREVGKILLILIIILLFTGMSEEVYSSVNYYWKKSQQLALLLLSCFWVFYGFVLLLSGIIKKNIFLRVAGLSLFGITLLKVIFVDLQSINMLYRIFLLFGVSIIFFTSGYFYRRKGII